MKNKQIQRVLTIFLMIVVGNGYGVYSQEQNGNHAIRNVVLVHGAFLDGSGWEGVYQELTQRGYNVTVTQHTLRDFDDDVAVVEKVISQQDGRASL